MVPRWCCAPPLVQVLVAGTDGHPDRLVTLPAVGCVGALQLLSADALEGMSKQDLLARAAAAGRVFSVEKEEVLQDKQQRTSASFYLRSAEGGTR